MIMMGPKFELNSAKLKNLQGSPMMIYYKRVGSMPIAQKPSGSAKSSLPIQSSSPF
jgi:hypothetical protein